MREICSTCQTEVSGTFCSNCGQKIGKKETTIRSLISDVIAQVFSLEKSVLSGIYTLTTSPKRIIHNYWQGHRNYFPSPGKMLFYSLTLAALHVVYVNSRILGVELNPKAQNPQFLFWLVFLPLLTVSSFLAFVRLKKSWAKHFISMLYLGSSFFLVLTILHDLVYLCFTQEVTDYIFPLYVALIFGWNTSVFYEKKKVGVLAGYFILQLFIFIALFVSLVFGIHLFNRLF